MPDFVRYGKRKQQKISISLDLQMLMLPIEAKKKRRSNSCYTFTQQYLQAVCAVFSFSWLLFSFSVHEY